jgi:predicted NAD/FAD-binding protein
MTYAHPCYTHESVAAQRELDVINTDGLAFAGAWQGWGFHEDGCRSGVRAAASLGMDW